CTWLSTLVVIVSAGPVHEAGTKLWAARWKMASGRTSSSRRRTPAWSRRSVSTSRTWSATASMFSRGLRHRMVPTTSTSPRSRQYSARWLPAIPVIPVIRTRMPPFQHRAWPNLGTGRDVSGHLPHQHRAVVGQHGQTQPAEVGEGGRPAIVAVVDDVADPGPAQVEDVEGRNELRITLLQRDDLGVDRVFLHPLPAPAPGEGDHGAG